MKLLLINDTEKDIDENQPDCFWQVLNTTEASDVEKKKAIQWLIEQEKDINATFGEEGNTVLHEILAIKNGALDAENRIQLLFSFDKTNVNAKNGEGQTPLEYAMLMIFGALSSELENSSNGTYYALTIPAFSTLLSHKNIEVNQKGKKEPYFLIEIFHQLENFLDDDDHEWSIQAKKYLKLAIGCLGEIFDRKGKNLIWATDQKNKDTFLHHALRLLYLSPPVGDITNACDRLIFSVLTGEPDYSAKNSDDKTPLELLEMYIRLHKNNLYQRSKFKHDQLNKHAKDIKNSYLPTFEKILFSNSHQYRDAKTAHLAAEECSIDLDNLFMKLHVYLCDKSHSEKGDYVGRLSDFSSLCNELNSDLSQKGIKQYLSKASRFKGKHRDIFRKNHYHNLRKQLLELSQEELGRSFSEYKKYLEFIRDHKFEFRLVGRRPTEVDICNKILLPTESSRALLSN